MDKKEEIVIGFLGFGTVGSGAVRILQEHKEEIIGRLGSDYRVKAICSPSINSRDTSWVLPQVIRTTDVRSIIEDSEIDILVEAIGGLEPARTYIQDALGRGKSVVTANKLLLAASGPELARRAAENRVSLGIEASVAGGIPVLNAVREGLSGERFVSIQAILNGTSNYILTEMERTNRPFAEILARAQELGYAEADPTLDIEGYDARDKLAILSMLCFGEAINSDLIPTTGITRLQPVDLLYSHNLGYTIRLICKALKTSSDELALRVSPALVRRDSMLAKVEGPFNAVLLAGTEGEKTFYYGRGAGAGPTGLAIVSDIIRAAREIRAGTGSLSPPFNYRELKPWVAAPQSSFVSSYFLRFIVSDRPGIIANLSDILARHGINIDSVMQEKPFEDRRRMPFVITLEKTPADRVEQALSEINRLDFLTEPPLLLPVEVDF
jgi:homoserine dehydrogenase